jgi:hypothetical protein
MLHAKILALGVTTWYEDDEGAASISSVPSQVNLGRVPMITPVLLTFIG